MKSTDTLTDVNPRAVMLARALLVVFGLICLGIGGAIWVSVLQAPTWALFIVLGIGLACLLSALFQGPSGVVATMVIFFFPWHR